MDEEEGRVCWKCYGENDHLVSIFNVINELKKKKISSTFKNISDRINVGDEALEITENELLEILTFAERNSYVDSKTYRNNISYKVNDKYSGGDCAVCGEEIKGGLVASLRESNNQENTEYINLQTFQSLQQEVNSLKELFYNFTQLTEDNRDLKLKLREKDSHINSLTQIINNLSMEYGNTPKQDKSSNHHVSTQEKNPLDDNYSWNVVKRKNAFTPYHVRNVNVNSIPLSNKFNSLQIDDDVKSLNEEYETFNMRVYNDDANIQTNSQVKSNNINGINAGSSVRNTTNKNNRNQPQFLANNDDIRTKVVPGNSSYANISRQGKKVCIFGASIAQRINIGNLNRCLDGMKAVKTCFPGATVSKATYYMKPTIEEESPDTVLLNIGTNNLTKTRQTDEETADEIIKMVDECHKLGVNEVLVSGLTVRHGYMNQVNNINNMLKQNAGNFDYTFIDNSNIQRHHLHKDGLHPHVKGMEILANNFINALNYKSIFNSFY